MAAKDEGFSLSKRQKARYERFDKQEDRVLQEHLAVVKQIEKEWNIFKEQNPKALKLCNKSQEARSNNSKYQFDISESANWKLISDNIQEKGNRLAEASDQYKKKYKLMETEKKEFYASCIKDRKNRELGKGLYDTSSSDEDNQKEVKDSQFLHLSKKEKERLDEECTYISEQIVALEGLHSDYKRERSIFPKDSYDYAVLDRERSKVDQFWKVYEHKLRERTRILQGERPTFGLQSEAEESDGGYSDIEGFREEKKYITN